MNFKTWLESFAPLSKETIQWWANYAANLKFPTEQSARDWLFA